MEHRNNFQAQWQELTSIIESEVIRDLRTLNKVDTSKLDKLFEEEKQKWNSSINYRGVWFKSLSDKSPSVASKFKQTLLNQKLTHTLVSMPTKSNYYVISAIIFIIAITIVLLIGSVVWKSIIGAVIVGVICNSLIISNYEKKSKKVNKEIVNFYKHELSTLFNQFYSLKL